MKEPGAPSPVILVVEDERHIRRFLRASLDADGYVVAEADSGGRGLIEAATRKPDLVIVDLGLPDMDGVQLIRELRSWAAVPILVLSARADESDKVEALDAEADDYLTKPFAVAELQARVRALLRRAVRGAGDAQAVIRFGEVEVDLGRRRVSRGNEPVHLTPIEYRLLTQLLANPDRVLTHRQLLTAVWGPGHVERSHYLRVYMAGLRRKLEADPNRPQHILTESGVGYRLVLGSQAGSR